MPPIVLEIVVILQEASREQPMVPGLLPGCHSRPSRTTPAPTTKVAELREDGGVPLREKSRVRHQERCPKTFAGVDTTFSWIFDPRCDDDLPYDSMLERFRMVRGRIDIRTRGWMEEVGERVASSLGDRRNEERDPFLRI